MSKLMERNFCDPALPADENKLIDATIPRGGTPENKILSQDATCRTYLFYA